MVKKAMLFPGQGAQYPGMGKAFCDIYPEANEVFSRANEILGMDLKKICFEGSEEEVNRTDICQPGILTTSISILTVLEKNYGLKSELFSGTAGLSLGEYTALVFSGVLTFEDAVSLVAKRGRYLQEDSDRNPSGMITLIGAEMDRAADLVAQCAKEGTLVMANYLAPGQIAISGDLNALEKVESCYKEYGIKRAIRLRVAGAFHSPLMSEGGGKLKAELEAVEFQPPRIPFSSNVTGGFIEDPEEIRSCLARQVTSPVLWQDTMKAFIDNGIGAFFEPGPGKVLSGLLKKVDRNLITQNLDDPGIVDAFVSAYGEKASC